MGWRICDEDEMIGCLRLLIFTLLLPLAAVAQPSMTDGVLINAKYMDRDMGKGLFTLKGDVQVVFQGQHISCDKAVMDLKKQQIVAEGNVILYNEKVHVEGDKVVFNYKQNTGYIYNGFVQSGQVVFEGDIIQKISEDRYIASNAHYTACDTCPPGWSFSGRQIDAEIGGYARIRRPVFKIAGVPILILPGLIVPLKSARQSGFLVPSLEGSGKGGFGFSESYFWAISRSQDLTITPKWYTKRGWKGHLDYRYVSSENSFGQLRGAWIRDEVFRQDKEVNLTDDFDRWFVWYNHHHELPNNYTHRAQVKAVSDLRYPRDFPLEISGHGDPALENKASISKSSDSQFASAEVDVYTNLLKSRPLSENDDAVHRFPELRYGLKESNILDSGLFASLDVQYVNFARDKFNYDDLELDASTPEWDRKAPAVGQQGEIPRDGQFDYDFTSDRPLDLMRTGQRLDVRPTVSYPFQVFKAFDILPAVSYRETQYRFYPTKEAKDVGFSDTAARRYLQTDLAIKTEFSRVYGSTDPQGNRTKHTIEPELSYSHIPWMRRPEHPFFGTFEGLQYSRQFEQLADADLSNPNTGVQFDYQDRTYEKQLVDFGIAQRLARKVFNNGDVDYRTLGIVKFSQSYDMNEARSTNRPHPWSSVNGLIDLRFDRFETYTIAQYNGYAKVTSLSSRVRFKDERKNFIEATYTRNYKFNNDYEVEDNGETRNVGLGAGLLSKYVDLQGNFQLEARTWDWISFGYSISFRPPGRCWLIRYEQSKVVGGDTSYGGSVAFDFGGEGKSNLF